MSSADTLKKALANAYSEALPFFNNQRKIPPEQLEDATLALKNLKSLYEKAKAQGITTRSTVEDDGKTAYTVNTISKNVDKWGGRLNASVMSLRGLFREQNARLVGTLLGQSRREKKEAEQEEQKKEQEITLKLSRIKIPIERYIRSLDKEQLDNLPKKTKEEYKSIIKERNKELDAKEKALEEKAKEEQLKILEETKKISETSLFGTTEEKYQVEKTMIKDLFDKMNAAPKSRFYPNQFFTKPPLDNNNLLSQMDKKAMEYRFKTADKFTIAKPALTPEDLNKYREHTTNVVLSQFKKEDRPFQVSDYGKIQSRPFQVVNPPINSGADPETVNKFVGAGNISNALAFFKNKSIPL